MSNKAKVIRNADTANRATDAETLAFLLAGIKPAIVTVLGDAISRDLADLEDCLDRHSKRLLNTPNCAKYPILLRDITLATALCKRIRSAVDESAEELASKMNARPSP